LRVPAECDGASKAAIETATEVWAKVEGTGLTVNIVTPAPARTPRAWRRRCAR
jgi:NAD(P)-dependent dehydrogenase (short-subunit alcohol dehydrogenase family)